jgi:beta-galactosidase
MPYPPPFRLHLGAAYYPEHWPEERWAEEARLMKEAGLSVVRMGEFAWSTFEPSEGEFHFDWLDRAIDLLAKANILTVLGTPTAAPPAWLVQTYPDTLAVDESGRRVQFGNRCHYCVTSPDFHAATQRIVSAMAEHFGPHESVIGWQLDNEYNRVCYCDRCRALFQQFLAEKYGSLEELNRRWSTSYWSQTYSAWEQIPLPIGGHNPGLMLEFKRFITESYARFQRLQLGCLRGVNAEPKRNSALAQLPVGTPAVNAWVTHNFMGWYDGFDHYKMNADLDLASWDWYIGTGEHDYTATGAVHDLTRGFKRQNFWVMETQPGSVNWSPVNNMLDKGEARAMAWHAVGHGADAILYWQWRSALGGQEQYHGTLVDASGQPRPFYEEVQQLGRDFVAASYLLAGSRFSARAAILNSYDSRWSIQWQRHHRDFDWVAHLNHYYRPFARRNVPVDIIPTDAPLDGYRLVILPALSIVDQGLVERLDEFLKHGGRLIITARTGMKDEANALLPSRQPGLLAELAGFEVEEYYALDEPVPVKGNWFTGEARQWAERLKIRNDRYASVIARYLPSNGWLDNQIAIAVRGVGSSGGLVYYVGAYLDDAAQDAMMQRVIEMAPLKPVLPAPEGVEVCRRTNPQGTEVYIVINHKKVDETVPLPWMAMDHLANRPVSKELQLGPYGVAVLTKIG